MALIDGVTGDVLCTNTNAASLRAYSVLSGAMRELPKTMGKLEEERELLEQEGEAGLKEEEQEVNSISTSNSFSRIRMRNNTVGRPRSRRKVRS